MDNKPIRRIFTYGTLMSGYSNNGRLTRGNSKFLGKAVTVEPYLLMDFGGFPGMYQGAQWGRALQPVQGELWEVNDAVLKSCDMLEGHPHMYRRTPIMVTVGNDKMDGTAVYDCETYFYQGAIRGVVCESGVWPRTYKLQKV